MMKRSSMRSIAVLQLLAAAAWMIPTTTSFVGVHHPTIRPSSSLQVTRDEYLHPHFHAPTRIGSNNNHKDVTSSSTTSTNTPAVERMLACAEEPYACPLEELQRLVQDLEQQNRIDHGLEDNNDDDHDYDYGFPNEQQQRELHQALESQLQMRKQQNNNNEEEESEIMTKADMKYHLKNMHEIAEYESH